jgi:TP901 family phage tail tape measure protein
MPEAGLRAKLTFLGGAAVAGMRVASKAFGNLRRNAQLVKSGVRDVNSSFSGLRTAALGLGAIGGVTVKRFKDFDAQMAAVRAVLGKAAAESFPALEAKAKQLGATTSFTAGQAAAAMENLARAGLKPNQILKAIGPVLNAAAAEGMGLASAADIVASNMRAFGLQSSDAAAIAGKLALVSARTNTNMASLQEGLKFVAPVARSLQIPLADTASSLGLLANVGIKGSLAGTALKNALLKMSKAAKGGRLAVAGQSVAIRKTAEGGVDLKNTMLGLVTALQNIKDPLKRQNAAIKLLGLRGLGAATAFDAIKKADADKLFKAVSKETGDAAVQMAKMRLDSFSGDWVRLTSAVDGAVIAVGKELAKAIGPTISDLTKFTSGIAKGSTFVTDFAAGVKEGIGAAKEVFAGMFDTFKSVVGLFGGGTTTTKEFIKSALEITAVVVKWKIYGNVLGRIGKIAGGVAKITRGLVSTAGGIVGAIASRIPRLAKLGGLLGKLTSKVSGIEKLTAQPVRVVNFDEAGIAGGLGAGARVSGAREIALTTGAMSGFRTGLNATAKKVPLIGGLLTSTFSGIKKSGGSLIGKFAGAGGLVLAAGALGGALGTLIDRVFGLSDKISSAAVNLEKRITKPGLAVARQARANLVSTVQTLRTLQTLQAIAARGEKVQVRAGGPQVAVTRELAQQRITASLRREKKTEFEIKAVLDAVKGALDRLPSAVEAGAERGGSRAKPQVNVGDVHKGVSGKQVESATRSGNIRAGARPAAARGT